MLNSQYDFQGSGAATEDGVTEMKIITNLARMLRFLLQCYRRGGVTKITIAQINRGEILKGKNVVVTGGSSGIGYAIAKKCVKEGARVVITGRNAETLRQASDEIGALPLVWDVSQIAGAESKLREAEKLLGGDVDIMVNNAGVYSYADFLDVTEPVWDNIHDINSKGLFFICQELAKHWIRNHKKGKIINIASNRGVLGDKVPYGMSKWGVVCLTRGLGKALFPKGIIVNGIAPGTVASGINGIDAAENAFINNPPSNRVGLPEEIAELAVFLASDAANHIVGQTIVCDGGESLN